MEEGVQEAEKLTCPNVVGVKKNKEKQENEEEEEEEEKGSKGTILNNLISNFLDATSTRTTVEDKSGGENITKCECEDEDEKDKDKESSSSGIFNKMISHLPEDAVPTTDEAAILIHTAID